MINCKCSKNSREETKTDHKQTLSLTDLEQNIKKGSFIEQIQHSNSRTVAEGKKGKNTTKVAETSENRFSSSSPQIVSG